MKVILHMGQGKTGTSALQDALHRAAPDLRRRGVLYPAFGQGFVSHPLLLALIGQAHRLPPWRLDALGGPDGAVRVAELAWAEICADVRQTAPDVMVLSCEYLIGQSGQNQQARLAGLLRPLSDQVTPVVYVRHPVDHYQARLRQMMKSWDRPFPPQSLALQRALLEAEAAFGNAAQLVAFDRSLLHGGDIVCDFATRFLRPWVQPADLPAATSNVSLSAEALVLLSRLRSEGGASYAAARAVASLVPQLEALDRGDPPAQPFTLLPEVAEAALRSATDHLWLAETGRLHVPGVRLDRIDGSPAPDWMRTARPETLFLHDPARLARLRRALVPVTGDGTRRLNFGGRILRALRRRLIAYPGRPTRSDQRP